MKRKLLCIILAFCCFAAAGCNKVEKETPPDYLLNSNTSTTLPDNSDITNSNSDTYSSSNDESTSSASSTSSSDQVTSSSSSTNDQQSTNSSSAQQSSSTSSSSVSSSKPQPWSTQSSKANPSVIQSSSNSMVSSSSSQEQYAQTSLPYELIPPQNTGIIGNYNQRAPKDWEIEFANEVFRLTNIERVKEGLPELKRMDNLNDAANIRAWEVLISYSHTRPDGRKSKTALDDAGVKFMSCGENIAAGQSTPEAVVDAWMNSPGHRTNILNPDFDFLGVGFYYDYDEIGGTNYRYFWSQNFCKGA